MWPGRELLWILCSRTTGNKCVFKILDVQKLFSQIFKDLFWPQRFLVSLQSPVIYCKVLGHPSKYSTPTNIFLLSTITAFYLSCLKIYMKIMVERYQIIRDISTIIFNQYDFLYSFLTLGPPRCLDISSWKRVR